MTRLRVLPGCIEVEPHDGEAMLDALRRAGYSHRFGCRRGGCGQCKVDVTEGTVHYQAVISLAVLSAAERAAGTALSCRGICSSDCVIRLRNDRLVRFLPWVTPVTADDH